MSPAELATIIRSALLDETDSDGKALFINVDVIDDEPGTLGVDAADGERMFVEVVDI